MRSLCILLVLFLLVVPLSSQTQATCTLTTFTVPGYNNAFPFGVNRYGTIVGQVVTNNNTVRRGFIRYNNGSSKIYVAPNSAETTISKRNASGVNVGTFTDNTASHRRHGFVLYGSTFRKVDYPGAVETFLTGINVYGTIVGYYFGPSPSVRYRGFKLKDGKFTPIDFPGALDTMPASISDSGVIVGTFDDGRAHGFILRSGAYTRIDHPKTVLDGTYLSDINANGNIIGQYYPVEGSRGFIYKGGVFKDVVVPGANRSSARAINGYGVVVGDAWFDNGVRGFMGKCQ